MPQPPPPSSTVVLRRFIISVGSTEYLLCSMSPKHFLEILEVSEACIKHRGKRLLGKKVTSKHLGHETRSWSRDASGKSKAFTLSSDLPRGLWYYVLIVKLKKKSYIIFSTSL